jgi:hypothetical protein
MVIQWCHETCVPSGPCRAGSGVIFNNVNAATNCPSGCGQILLTDETAIWPPVCSSYPCPDQIGRGQDQSLSPLYIWNNTGLPVGVEDAVAGMIQLGRDDVVSEDDSAAKPGYVPYTYPHPLTVAVAGDVPDGTVEDEGDVPAEGESAPEPDGMTEGGPDVPDVAEAFDAPVDAAGEEEGGGGNGGCGCRIVG